MFTLHIKSAVIYSLAFFMFLFHALADAGLIRGGGRGTHSDSNAYSYVLVNDDNINDLGLMQGFSSLEYESFNSGDPALLSTPDECVTNFGSLDDLNDAITFGGWVEEPCYYEVYENDLRLEFEGYGRAFFQQASSVDVVWRLSQAGMADIILNGFMSDSAALLDVLMPPELVPGEYILGLEVTFHSGPDNSFFSSTDIHDRDDVDCIDLAPGDLQCYLPNWGGASDTLSFSAEYAERLVVLAGTSPFSVNAPASLGLFLFGFFALRRRQQ